MRYAEKKYLDHKRRMDRRMHPWARDARQQGRAALSRIVRKISLGVLDPENLPDLSVFYKVRADYWNWD